VVHQCLRIEGLEKLVVKEATAYIEEHKRGKRLKNHEYALIVKSLSQLKGQESESVRQEYFA